MNRSRDLHFESAANIRDLGGILSKDGRKIKDSLLIRSSELSRLNEEEAKILYEDIGVKTVFDFRSRYEAMRAPDVIGEGVRLIPNEIATNESFGVRRDEETMKELDRIMKQLRESDDEELALEFMRHFYRSFAISDFSLRQYGKFLHYALDHEDPVLWHCSMGKDRCGVGTVLVLELLGVDHEDIIEDYLYTNEIYGIKDTGYASGFEIADRSYIEAFYDEVFKAYGDLASFFEQMNISERDRVLFRERVLV